jgi:hypothetical protein
VIVLGLDSAAQTGFAVVEAGGGRPETIWRIEAFFAKRGIVGEHS